MPIRGRKGQGLMEYLVLVALISVSAIAVVSVVGTNIREQFAQISTALRNGKEKIRFTRAGRATYQERGLDDYAESAQSGTGQ